VDWEEAYQLYKPAWTRQGSTWEQYHQTHMFGTSEDADADAENVLHLARPLLQNVSGSHVAWVWEAATDPEKRAFLRDVLHRGITIPVDYIGPLVRAAVYSLDPSRPRWFLHPLDRDDGRSYAAELIVSYANDGKRVERIGGCFCLYHVGISNIHPGLLTMEGIREQRCELILSEESYSIYRGLRSDKLWKIREFVQIDDDIARRNLLGRFSLDPGDYSLADRSLVHAARDIASSLSGSKHPYGGDEYPQSLEHPS